MLDNILFVENAPEAAFSKSKVRELLNERRVSSDNYETFLKTSSLKIMQIMTLLLLEPLFLV